MNMNTGLFSPSKRNGLLFHGSLLVALAVISIWGFINLSHTTMGEDFVTYLLVGLIAFAPIPWIGYRAYALLRVNMSSTAMDLNCVGVCATKPFR